MSESEEYTYTVLSPTTEPTRSGIATTLQYPRVLQVDSKVSLYQSSVTRPTASLIEMKLISAFVGGQLLLAAAVIANPIADAAKSIGMECLSCYLSSSDFVQATDMSE